MNGLLMALLITAPSVAPDTTPAPSISLGAQAAVSVVVEELMKPDTVFPTDCKVANGGLVGETSERTWVICPSKNIDGYVISKFVIQIAVDEPEAMLGKTVEVNSDAECSKKVTDVPNLHIVNTCISAPTERMVMTTVLTAEYFPADTTNDDTK